MKRINAALIGHRFFSSSQRLPQGGTIAAELHFAVEKRSNYPFRSRVSTRWSTLTLHDPD